MTQIIPYDQACRALSEAKSFDDVKELSDKAEAMRVYARRAGNRDLEIDAAEIRIRAERRLGELIRAARESGLLHRGGRPGGSLAATLVSLSDIGVSRKLSSSAQQLAQPSAPVFEQQIATWRQSMAWDGRRGVVALKPPGVPEEEATPFDFRLLDGARLGRVRLSAIPDRVLRLESELRLLQLVAGHAVADSGGARVMDVIGAGALARMVLHRARREPLHD